MAGENRSNRRRAFSVLAARGLVAAIWLLSLSAGPQALGQATVTTLGGGRLSPEGPDAGFTDGNILQASQFNVPFGCAVDSIGRVYVADRDNGALRRLELSANRCRTLLSNLARPVAVVVDSTNIVYVLTQGDGSIHRVDRGVATVLASGLVNPTALAYDRNQSLFVTQSDGKVYAVDLASRSVAPVLAGLNQPSGIAVLDSGRIAVSELGTHSIGIWDPRTGRKERQIGSGQAGFADGPAELARFNQPYHLALAPGGSLVVADRGNSRVRLVEPDAFVSTLYGVDPGTWEGPTCTSCSPMILPGWYDGPVEFAESRDPVGVAVSSDGRIFTTETYYHLVREIDDAVFTTGGDTGATNLVVLPPSISPASGYYPMGQTITVSNPNSSSFLASAVYYTTDGSEPNTNSYKLELKDGQGRFFWTEKQHDLTGLRVRAFLGTNASSVVSGQPVAATEIGIPQNLTAGVGSSVILPVVMNLRTNDQLKSLQFRVEITPETASVPMIPDTCRPRSFSTNDFITLYTSAETTGPSLFNYAVYEIGRTRGIAVTFIGTNANLFLKNYAVASLLSVPIPASAPLGSRYLVQVLNPSGTSDGLQTRVDIGTMPDRFLTVGRATYLVGDTSPGTWYNGRPLDAAPGQAGFGDGILDNSDVNNVFAAALGNRVPYEGTDLFDAMDVFPEDTVNAAGGDGLIRFLDWQVVLMRSLGLDSARWSRTWSDGGVLKSSTDGSGSGLADMPGTLVSANGPGAVWVRQVALSSPRMEGVVPGTPCDVPVYVDIAPGCQLAGLAFRATVEPIGGAPQLLQPVQFTRNANLAAPVQSAAPAPGVVLCGWPLVPAASFDPPLTGRQLLGHLRVVIPYDAQRGQVYSVRFTNADGSPNIQTQYDFETRLADLWVLSQATQAPDPLSLEWKEHFFGSSTSPDAAADQDPDHDGIPNSMEYLAGTNPLDPESALQLRGERDSSGRRLVLRWLSAPGKSYQIESAAGLSGNNWSVIAGNLPGDGRVQEYSVNNTTSTTSFYRIRLQP